MKLVAKNLGLEYSDGSSVRKVLNNINLEIKEKECAVLIGPSGSGKSSLMYLLSALRKPTTGSVFLNDVDISKAKNIDQIRYENFGFIFQQHFLIPYLSVIENICKAKKDDNIKVKENAYELLDSLGIKKLANKLPYQLSGGERQRVAIARALIKNPVVIFADEPTASLDKENALQIYSLLIKHSSNSILVMTTHDISLLGGTERVIDVENLNITSSTSQT